MQFLNYKLSAGSPPASNQFFDIVTGEAVIPSGSNSVTVTFAAKTMSKTFFYHTWEIDSSNPYPGEIMVMGEMISSTQITFSTWSNVPGNCRIRYFVFEGTPVNPISVQHGKVSWTGQSVQFPVISAVTLNQSFILSSDEMAGNTMGSDDPTLAKFGSTTQVELRKNATKVNGNTAYQVISNSRWVTSETNFQLTGGTNSAIMGLTGGHTFPSAQSFMVGTGRVITTPIPGNEFPRVSFNSTTQVRADSYAVQSNTWDICVFAVDTGGDMTIQNPSLTIPAASASQTAVITSIPTARAAAFSGKLLASSPGHNSATATGEQICDKIDYNMTILIQASRDSAAGQAQQQSVFAVQVN